MADLVVKKQSPDYSRSESLIQESEKSFTILQDFVKINGINDTNANHIIKNAYDIIMESVRARMFREGFGSSGQGAHDAEVAYIRELGFKESEVEFANQLRYFRNGILYYGKCFDSEYARKVLTFLDKIYSKLKK